MGFERLVALMRQQEKLAFTLSPGRGEEVRVTALNIEPRGEFPTQGPRDFNVKLRR